MNSNRVSTVQQTPTSHAQGSEPNTDAAKRCVRLSVSSRLLLLLECVHAERQRRLELLDDIALGRHRRDRRLLRDLVLRRGDRRGVAEERAAQRRDGAGGRDGLEVGVEVVDEGDAGGDLDAHDAVLGDGVEELEEAADRVAVRRDEHRVAVAQRRRDLLVPERQAALDGILEALARRKHRRVDVRVHRVGARVVLRALLDRRRRDVVRAAPLHHPIGPVRRDRLLLVLALQRAVVALVEAVVLYDRHVRLLALLERDAAGALRAL
eukprot:509418-Prymnesium_polylepis.3